jgi:outer membrane protein OmpA-like peptidoglycan-associated protein
MQKILPKNATNQPRPFHMHKSAVPFLLISLLAIHGCAVAVIGLGAGAGAAAYFNGKLTKTYESEYHETIRASKDVLKKLKIPVSETISDELKTEIRAKRPDGTPVTIEVVRIDENHNEVSVRTGTLGVWDRRVSEQIHGFIDRALGGTVVVYEKPQEEQATEVAQPATAEPEIIEEDLAENSAPTTVQAKPKPNPESTPHAGTAIPDLEKKRLRAAQLLENSAFFIFFEEDSNELTSKSMAKLDRIYGIVANNANARLTLSGYSDSLGETSYNQMISELRASAVKTYLVGKGIAPSRMTAVGHGARNSIATNKTAEGRRLNSRVEIEIITAQ